MKTRYFLYCSWIALGLSACRSSSAPQLIGGMLDAHGCLTAAGYTWSEMRKDCIRIFEEGVEVEDDALRPYESSYAVFAPDSSQAEIFRPSPYHNEVLTRNGAEWRGANCRLLRRGQRWQLLKLAE